VHSAFGVGDCAVRATGALRKLRHPSRSEQPRSFLIEH